MGGQVLFQDALAARLDLIKPSQVDVQNCLTKHPIRLTKGIDKVMSLLHAKGVAVYLVSGGFRQVHINNHTSSLLVHFSSNLSNIYIPCIYHFVIFVCD